MNISRLFSVLLAALVPLSVQARTHVYMAQADESTWSHSGSAVQCELRHAIPQYGEAVFTQSVDNELQFTVSVMRGPKHKDKEATLQSIPPEWKHHESSRDLGTVDIDKSHQPFKMGRDMARRLFLELEEGMFPTFYYSDWADEKDEINVAISSVNFLKARKEFTSCLAGLLPYGFKDIRLTRVYFQHNKSLLSDKARKRLDQISAYIIESPDDVIVEIAGHTDAIGFRRYNKTLSMKRAAEVQAYLKSKGVPESKMMVSGFGEVKPAATNRTLKGRALNRRVVVTLSK